MVEVEVELLVLNGSNEEGKEEGVQVGETGGYVVLLMVWGEEEGLEFLGFSGELFYEYNDILD